MPSENHTFTTHVDPVSPPYAGAFFKAPEKLVEAPGTAPGSATIIPYSVYRRSRLPDIPNIRAFWAYWKGLKEGWAKQPRSAILGMRIQKPPGTAQVKQYLDLMAHIRDTGTVKQDRTGTGTRSIFGAQMRFDLNDGFPVLTTKKLHLKSIIHELLWFIAGDTNIKYLNDNGVKIWDAWADENGDLGPVYGHQWRSWPTPDGTTVDQLANVIEQIKSNPDSRRLMVSAWNVADIGHMALPPCHCLFQFYVADGKLSCQLYQRSADFFLGVPFNIASYALLTMMVAQVTGYQPGDFVHTFGDAHLYSNHMEQVEEQLSRTPLALPVMHINPDVSDIFSFTFDDFTLKNYESAAHISAPVAV